MAETPGMTPEQIYNLWDSAIKILGGAIVGGIGTWFSARHAYKIKREETDLDREKIRYERDKGLVGRAVELMEEMDSSLCEIKASHIEVIAYEKNEKFVDDFLLATKKQNDYQKKYISSADNAKSTIVLLGDDDSIGLFNLYRKSCSVYMEKILDVRNMEDLEALQGYKEVVEIKGKLQKKLAELFRSMI